MLSLVVVQQEVRWGTGKTEEGQAQIIHITRRSMPTSGISDIHNNKKRLTDIAAYIRFCIYYTYVLYM